MRWTPSRMSIRYDTDRAALAGDTADDPDTQRQSSVIREEPQMKFGKLLAGISALCVLAGGTALAQDKPFAGVTVNVFTQTGAIQEPLQRRAPDFEALTG